MKSRIVLKLRLLEFIQKIVDIYGVSQEDIVYYDSIYTDLDEDEYMFKMELLFGSYMYIDDISNDERVSFARGMEAFIKVNRSKMDTDFMYKSDEYKKNTTLRILRKEYKKEKHKLMYLRGIDAGIDLDNEYMMKKELLDKVRSRTLS